jgi:large subunit ribosomal protein L15
MTLKLTDLKPNKGSRKKLKRVGRGHASGSGQQAGRGHKGQQSRSGGSGVPYQGFEGGQKPLYKRSPKLKRFAPISRIAYAVVNVGELEKLSNKKEVITIKTLVTAGLVRKTAQYLKVLGDGELKTGVTVQAHKFTETAKQKIEKAAGKAEVIATAQSSGK